ncbi:MAG: UpxY family transcription antiterminator [Salinivirgaceae bacterium]|nr:UpxY family transcription antiterminator [Salinivirgaceae bacterium]
MQEKTWYAIYTKSRAEKKVKELMEERGYEVYLPLIKTLRQWTDRKKMVEVPLISSYIFVCVSELEYYDILNTPGAVAYVTFEGKAAPIRGSQIETMRKAVDGKQNITLVNELLSKGQKVKIVSGPLKGSEGEYIETKHKCNFVINLSHIGFSLFVEVNAENVIKL